MQAWLQELQESSGSRVKRLDRPAQAASAGKFPRITAAICTRNRPFALIACLKSITAQAYRNHEIVVVDNGRQSAAFREQIVDITSAFGARHVSEGQAGIVCARNRALRESDADVVAFLDDQAEPGWLAAIADKFSRGTRGPGPGTYWSCAEVFAAVLSGVSIRKIPTRRKCKSTR